MGFVMTVHRRRRAASLSERDIEILRLVHRFRLMTASQIQRMVVTTGSRATQARRTRSVLQRLTECRYLIRLDRQIGGIHAGSHGTVYRISGRGVGVLARTDGIDRKRVGTEPGQRFVNHVLAVTELAAAIEERAEADSQLQVVSFQPEPLCWRQYPAGHGGRVTLRPDAFVHTRDDEFDYAYFVEIDLATESLPTIARHCQAYIAYWKTGIEQQRLGVFPKVLWVVPHARRHAQIEKVLRRLPAEHQELFAVAATEDAWQTLAGRELPNYPQPGHINTKGGTH